MKYWKIASLLLVLGIAIACSSDSDNPEDTTDSFDRGAMLANWADNIIVPAYGSFNADASEMKTATTVFNENPTVENLQALRTAWKKAYVSFQNVSMFEIGKAEDVRFRNRLNIYPTNSSKIEELIANGSYDFSLPSNIDVQGFPALDYLINGLATSDAEIISFYSTHTNAEAYRNYLQLLSETISTLTNQVLTDWTGGYRDTFVANTSASASGSVDKLTNDYILYFEKSLRAGKVGIPAGVFSQQPLPQNVEGFYKKDISKELLLEALDASNDFFIGKNFNGNTNGQSFKSYLDYLNTIKNGGDLSSLINAQFAAAKNKANQLDASFIQQIETDNSKMQDTYDELQRIVILLKVDMVQALDISIDYVDSDGD